MFYDHLLIGTHSETHYCQPKSKRETLQVQQTHKRNVWVDLNETWINIEIPLRHLSFVHDLFQLSFENSFHIYLYKEIIMMESFLQTIWHTWNRIWPIRLDHSNHFLKYISFFIDLSSWALETPLWMNLSHTRHK